jgi:hypothetical protein
MFDVLGEKFDRANELAELCLTIFLKFKYFEHHPSNESWKSLEFETDYLKSLIQTKE